MKKNRFLKEFLLKFTMTKLSGTKMMNNSFKTYFLFILGSLILLPRFMYAENKVSLPENPPKLIYKTEQISNLEISYLRNIQTLNHPENARYKNINFQDNAIILRNTSKDKLIYIKELKISEHSGFERYYKQYPKKEGDQFYDVESELFELIPLALLPQDVLRIGLKYQKPHPGVPIPSFTREINDDMNPPAKKPGRAIITVEWLEQTQGPPLQANFMVSL